MTDDSAPLELRSTPDDATIREGLRRAYRPYVVLVLALFFLVVPPLTIFRAWLDDAWLVRTLLALLVMGAGAWSTGRALRSLVQTGLADRSGKEVVVRISRSAPPNFMETQRAVVVRGRGLGTVVLARRDVPVDLLTRQRVV